MKILWLIPKWTFPVNDGARVATDSLIKNTIKCGAEVDVLCLPTEEEVIDLEEMKETWGVRSIHVIPRAVPKTGLRRFTYYLKNFLFHPLTPLTFTSFAENRIVSQIEEHLAKSNYDFVLLDGLHLGVPLLKMSSVSWSKIKV